MKTEWSNVAKWYDEYLKGDDTYQSKVIAPNLMRLLDPKPGMTVLDLACGQGFFSKLCAKAGANVVGIDQSKTLLKIAEADAGSRESYVYGDAQKIGELKIGTFDAVFSILAFENIKNIKDVMEGVLDILKDDGRVLLVLLHPSFRIPKHSGWGWDSKKGVQYRSVYRYLSEISIPIELRPFKGGKESTVTFHRPLQWYMKIFKSTGFAITSIEEWISHKKSEPGKKQKAEDAARKEIPMFLAIELKRI